MEVVVGASEVAAALGVSRQRVHQLANAYDDFPDPIAVLGTRKLWRAKDIERWARKHPERPSGRPVQKRGQG